MQGFLGTTALAVALGIGLHVGDARAQQIQLACDANDDGVVDAIESRLCSDREFDSIAEGEEVLTEERLAAAAMGEGGMSFMELDEDGDGQITREEWTGYIDARIMEATEATGGQMATEEYGAWREEGMRP